MSTTFSTASVIAILMYLQHYARPGAITEILTLVLAFCTVAAVLGFIARAE
jgi:hypothetical protein